MGIISVDLNNINLDDSNQAFVKMLKILKKAKYLKKI